MCAGVAAQKKMDRMGMMSFDVMSIEEMMLAVPEATQDCNPNQELHEQSGMEHMMDAMSQTDWNDLVAFDDQSGARMKPELVAAARKEEIAYFKSMGVYQKVSTNECWAETGKAPIPVRWIDINKGHGSAPNYRSRLVAKEYRNRRPAGPVRGYASK